jgi:ATP adenylyltransferase
MEYIKSLGKEEGCFFCRYLENSELDEENLVLWRTVHSIVVINKFPYNNGHLLIAPRRHIPDFTKACDEELLELIKLIGDCQRALTAAIEPHGFNVGMNFGRCAGAGLPDHIHIHVVPRWEGDTNYMHVCSDTDVISQSMSQLYSQLKKISVEENLPSK